MKGILSYFWTAIASQATVVGVLCAAITTITAIVALTFAWIQIREQERLSQQQRAIDMYRDWLKMVVEEPRFASPTLTDLKSRKFRARYEYAVSYFLMSAEEIFSAYPDNELWRNTIAGQFNSHRCVLCKEGDWSLTYEKPVVELIGQFKNDVCETQDAKTVRASCPKEYIEDRTSD